jgi:hypothetical protein
MARPAALYGNGGGRSTLGPHNCTPQNLLRFQYWFLERNEEKLCSCAFKVTICVSSIPTKTDMKRMSAVITFASISHKVLDHHFHDE